MAAEIFTYISSYGFPIVMALLMLWDRRESVDEMRKAIENNTLALTKLLERIGNDEN